MLYTNSSSQYLRAALLPSRLVSSACVKLLCVCIGHFRDGPLLPAHVSHVPILRWLLGRDQALLHGQVRVSYSCCY
jgi:hypothetical protein